MAMKMCARLSAWLALSALLAGAEAASRSHLRASRAGALRTEQRAASGQGAEAQAQVALKAAVANDVMSGKTTPMKAAHTLARHMNLNDALQRLDGKLPADVVSLVRLASKKEAKATAAEDLDEESMAKARRILNGRIEDSWVQLDDKIIECKALLTAEEDTLAQVKADLARFASNLNELGSERVSAAEGYSKKETERIEVESEKKGVTDEHTKMKNADRRELKKRQNDLAVFDYILNATSCANAGLVQVGVRKPKQSALSVCSTGGGLRLRFRDPARQAEFRKLMTPGARRALQAALQGTDRRLALLEVGAGAAASQQPSQTVTASNETIEGVLAAGTEEDPVWESPSDEFGWKKCGDVPYNCARLHDMLSVEWGKFRDTFDELSAKMEKDQADFEETERNFNNELTVINDAKASFMQKTFGVLSAINSLTLEQNEKEIQKDEVLHKHKEISTDCRTTIEEILFTDMCGVRTVRNSLLANSEVSPPDSISDCDVSDWEGGECLGPNGNPLECDDSCPDPDPLKCGGWQTVEREIITPANDYGVACPVLAQKRKCNQKKCEVHCKLSEWSGWSKCSADCEGGEEIKTRDILTQPMNGGSMCDTVEGMRFCNTGSCDRDCKLADWSEWSPCSMACSLSGEHAGENPTTGLRTRTRSVLVPIRAQGKCPTKASPERLEEEECNSHSCIGDEICISKQDLVIALDGSGSMRPSGFEAVKAFAANLTDRYKSEYFGADAMQVGVVVFGNGAVEVLADGSSTVAQATQLIGLSTDMSAVRTAIEGAEFQGGFTNMAQGLAKADFLLKRRGRPDAQSAIMVVSDGKFSMAFQTAEKAQELKDEGTMIFMVPIAEFPSESLESLKKWASSPWETNYERIDGIQSLKYNPEIFAQRMVSKFCPLAFSPSMKTAQEEEQEFMLIHENGWPDYDCGWWYGEGDKSSVEECAEAARKRGYLSFSYGREYARGYCYSEATHVTMEAWENWLHDREHPSCPNGHWIFNPYFDTYAIKPQ